jgi:release factor glutamine methyltransferase
MAEAAPAATAGAALRAAATALAGISDTPRLDAEMLMAHALGIDRAALLLGPPHRPVPPGFAALLERRLAHEPVAYITGRRGFWTIELLVGPGALIPRPDGETLLDAAVAHFGGAGPAAVLDLGTGPGTLLFAALAEWPGARGLGIDASPAALAWAARNARALGLADRAELRAGDWSVAGWAAGLAGRFDLILANPPYVEAGAAIAPQVRDWEPAAALFAGADGLDAYRLLVPQLPALLAPGGIAAIEIGAIQADAVAGLAAAAGLLTDLRRDLAGRPRCIVARLPG